MNTHNFINFHVLFSHSPSCLNRDDMNMQKTAVFGDVSRVRISSQSLKRAMRINDYYTRNFGKPSIRTRSLEKMKALLIDALQDEFEEEIVEEAANRFVKAATTESDDGGNESETERENDAAGNPNNFAVAPWVTEEIRVICRIIADVKKEGLTTEETEKALKKVGKSTGKGKDKKTLSETDCINNAMDAKISKRIEEKISELRSAIGSAMDVALSGRMATSGLMLPVDGALAVAHAITTHAVTPQDVDWFTAVDDLTQDAGETGAGHLNTQQFSSGVFYRYASLNLKQLQVNFGLIPSMKSMETSESRKKALEAAKHFFHLFTTVVPSAKRNSFAADNPADFAIVSFADLPISLANAFENPVVSKGGFLDPSINKITSYWKNITEFHSLKENAVVASSLPFDCPDGLTKLKTLAVVENWIENDGTVKL
ncbi:MAG: type I-E CRISPR-associated protein Cas7/Cse4/CasC [Desulfatirhabdiaceae bacterium]